MEKLIKNHVAKDNWQVDKGIKTAKKAWNLEDNMRWKTIVNQVWQDLSHGTVWESKNDTKYSRSELSKVVGSICDKKDFVMKTREGLVDMEGAKIDWTKRSYLKREDPPPISRSNLSKQIQILTKTLDYKQQCTYLPLRVCITKEWGPKLQGSANSCTIKYWIMQLDYTSGAQLSGAL